MMSKKNLRSQERPIMVRVLPFMGETNMAHPDVSVEAYSPHGNVVYGFCDDYTTPRWYMIETMYGLVYDDFPHSG